MRSISTTIVVAACLLLASLFTSCDGFMTSASRRLSLVHQSVRPASKLEMSSGGSSTIVVISPPGGVGEVAAVKAASMGSLVKWFVVSSKYAPKSSSSVSLTQAALQEMEAAGGKVEIAGAEASSLLISEEDPNSAIPAVSKWCGSADAIVCTLDGVEAAIKGEFDEEEPIPIWKSAVKIAVREGSGSIAGPKVCVLPLEEEVVETKEPGILSSFFGGGAPMIPASLSEALGSSGSIKLRHGELFGVPESSPAFSALVKGPLKNPVLCEEYAMRRVRIDPSISGSGNRMMGKTARSSRHAVGQLAALMVCGKLPATKPKVEVCISSLTGIDEVTLDVWQEEYKRMQETASGTAGRELFSAKFASVPDKNRLAEWLATKWAPTVMKTYDIAAIRRGARPVYARRTDDEGVMEIVWQELVDFQSVETGRMMVKVSDDCLVATRGPGDASKGFGKISMKPLQGESVLVQSLADAASQAIAKGLASKPKPKAKPKAAVKPPTEPATSFVSAVTIESEPAEAVPDTGPRQAGARRSTQRARGTRKRKNPLPPKAEAPQEEKKEEDDTFQ